MLSGPPTRAMWSATVLRAQVVESRAATGRDSSAAALAAAISSTSRWPSGESCGAARSNSPLGLTCQFHGTES